MYIGLSDAVVDLTMDVIPQRIPPARSEQHMQELSTAIFRGRTFRSKFDTFLAFYDDVISKRFSTIFFLLMLTEAAQNGN